MTTDLVPSSLAADGDDDGHGHADDSDGDAFG